MTSRLRLIVALASVLVLSILATPASASPILAPFSRTANSSANDFIGTAPAPLQSLNNINRTGLVETFLTDGDISGGNYAQAYTFVQFGVIRVIANTEALLAGGPFTRTATASGAFQDTLPMDSPAGTPGVTYRFVGSFSISGTQSAIADAPGLSTTNALYEWRANQSGASVGGHLESFQTSSNGFTSGVNFLGTTIPVEFDFTWGIPVIFEVILGAGPASSGSGAFAAASQDMGHSLIWQGATVFTTSGAPLGGPIGSASGTNWADAAVPEPSTFMLMGLGLAALLGNAVLRSRSASAR